MTELRYALLDPTGNRTILVETPVPPADQPFIAGQIMDKEPDAEQAGFLSPRPDGIALRMAGGEFCGNASMSAAVLYAMDNGITDGVVTVAVSGAPDPVPVAVSSLEDGGMRGTVTMPAPVAVGKEPLPECAGYPVVRFPGITHVIVEDPLRREEAESLAPLWCRFLRAESLGIMLFDREAGKLVPLVYVPGAGTLFWENSCASGTAAVGAYLSSLGGRVSLSVRQPGGALRIDADGGDLRLTGTVRFRYRRTLRIDPFQRKI